VEDVDAADLASCDQRAKSLGYGFYFWEFRHGSFLAIRRAGVWLW
jgi:hypothetical protein